MTESFEMEKPPKTIESNANPVTRVPRAAPSPSPIPQLGALEGQDVTVQCGGTIGASPRAVRAKSEGGC